MERGVVRLSFTSGFFISSFREISHLQGASLDETLNTHSNVCDGGSIRARARYSRLIKSKLQTPFFRLLRAHSGGGVAFCIHPFVCVCVCVSVNVCLSVHWLVKRERHRAPTTPNPGTNVCGATHNAYAHIDVHLFELLASHQHLIRWRQHSSYVI